MSGAQFVHLHVHTHYSLLDGATRIEALIARAKQYGCPAVAITDHGNLFGAVEFYIAARAAGIKPIIGLEAYLAPEHRKRRDPREDKDSFHLLLLAQNLEGYQNLLRLASIGYTEGFYRRPRIDKEILAELSGGLLCTSTCIGGEIPQTFLSRDAAAARGMAETYLAIFGADRFFIELQDHGIPEQKTLNPELVELAEQLGVATIATNDVHYLEKDDVEAHDVLCCINTGKLLSDQERFKFPSGEFYFKTPEQMAGLFPRWPDALANTARVAEMCNLELKLNERHAPVFRIPSDEASEQNRARQEAALNVENAEQNRARKEAVRGRKNAEAGKSHGLEQQAPAEGNPPESSLGTEGSAAVAAGGAGEALVGNEAGAPPDPQDARYLRRLVYEGAKERYGQLSAELTERIEYELQVVTSKGFASYFLILWDCVRYARDHGIPVGARGSGCSSVIAYCLRISAPDPIRYGLYFERFMDPDRDEMPDIDLDICQNGRAGILEYVREKYGHVAQIITFGTLKARAAVKDVARVMGLGFEDANQLTKLIPAELHITLDTALAKEPELKKRYEADVRIRKIIDVARRLEGVARNAGIHAAGLVVADQPLMNLLPLYKAAGQDALVTQFDGPTVEKVGLLKMDFLGLRTLTTLERARQLAEKRTGNAIDFERIDLTDQRVYRLFARGETKGIFQFESGGMRDVIMRMKPNRIEDLIAANALFRPGPMEYIADYVARKHGAHWTTPHPIMSDVLAETYGIMVYQEQVSRIVNRLGNVELKAAFRLAKAISKKKTSMIETMREPFLQGCAANGVSRKVAEQVFEDILKFGGYAFNKAHSTGYALVAYQTAWMKTYYPVEFMAALMTFEMVSTEKVAEYREECSQMGIAVEPPDINRSEYEFVVERATPVESVEAPATEQRPSGGNGAAKPGVSRGAMRFGLGAIKGVGSKAVAAIVEERQRGGPYRHIFDFCERVDLTAVNRGAIEAMICAGAFDTTGAMRRALCDAIEHSMAVGQRAQWDKKSGQMALFGAPADLPVESSPPPSLSTAEWSEAEMLRREKAVLGFYITRHPLAHYSQLIEACASASTANLADMQDGREVILGGMVSCVRTITTRSSGKQMGIVTVEDLSGRVEAIVFPDDLKKYRDLLTPDSVVLFEGQVDRKREEPALRVKRVVPVSQALEAFAKAVVFEINEATPLEELTRVLRGHPGEARVYVIATTRDGLAAEIECPPGLRVSCGTAFMQELVRIAPDSSPRALSPTRRQIPISLREE